MSKTLNKQYKRGELLEVMVDNRYYAIVAIQGKRVVTKYGAFKFDQIEGWSLPWGNTFAPNLHNILPLCNKGSQKLW